ncbi:hypothetical protein [Microbacterium sp.]|uniref:hypothetical protein n=1 Tax=Microbacterium sp. TaxID=51671 RepID=UPI002811308C|nr:hypothetical protein [Microbacterium sp.]
MDIWYSALAAAAETPKAPNLWGALGCAMAYAAALLTALDALADMLLARTGKGGLGPAMGLKLGGKLTASGIAVVSAAIVLALDANWFAFTGLSIVFVGVVGVSVILMRRSALRQAESAEGLSVG